VPCTLTNGELGTDVPCTLTNGKLGTDVPCSLTNGKLGTEAPVVGFLFHGVQKAAKHGVGSQGPLLNAKTIFICVCIILYTVHFLPPVWQFWQNLSYLLLIGNRNKIVLLFTMHSRICVLFLLPKCIKAISFYMSHTGLPSNR
jgi:hypothetical protein